MKIAIINPIVHPHWNRQIVDLDGASIFHTANWAGVLAESYGYRPVYVSAFQDGQLAGCLPLMDVRSFLTGRRGVSLPFTDECRPLCRSDELFDALWDWATAYGRRTGWKHIELRGPHPAYMRQPAHADFLVHSLALGATEQRLLDGFRNSTRRNIRKALEAGITVQRSREPEAVTMFYRLNCRTRRMHGLPPQPFKFFRKIHEHIIVARQGFVSLVRQNKTVIAAAVFFHFKESLLYKYGASDRRYQHLRANNLLMWEAVKWAAQNRLQRFNFGRSEPVNQGLLQFKRGWGADEECLRYYKYDVKSNSFRSCAPKVKSSYRVFEKLPLPLLRLSGQILYRHMG